MRTIYFDHAATSWPKPEPVVAAVEQALTEFGGNPGRGAYSMAVGTARAIHHARRELASLLGVTDAKNLLFQPGCTQAMNLVLFGLLSPGDRIVACPTEHNAVARPLNVLAARGVEVIIADADEAGFVDPEVVESLVAAAPTRAVVCQHAGNVSGAIQPVADLADIAHAHGALMLVDGAQAGGHLQVDLSTLGADAWACSGHKGLLGPQGVGVLYLAPGCEPEELVFGGSGQGDSEHPRGPSTRPDRYEAGTPNTPGIVGLGAAASWLLEHGDEQRLAERSLTSRLADGIRAIPGFRVLGPDSGEHRAPVVSAVHETVPADEIAFALDRGYGVAVRSGLHCAPWAHRSLGTLESGAVRMSVGFGLQPSDVDDLLGALITIGSKTPH
ncbi:MAG: aminotransferase class V-fold PLP-dependent enzyme [Coriobacteriia bacterium]|nr:aminotransferase class V-fold PLP-dependent enzyme [Coriobacteriia bacterium]